MRFMVEDGKLPLEMFENGGPVRFSKTTYFFFITTEAQKERDSKQDGVDKHSSLTEPVRAFNSVIAEIQFSGRRKVAPLLQILNFCLIMQYLAQVMYEQPSMM